ncbi:MAG: transglutaminase family protein [bacterium]
MQDPLLKFFEENEFKAVPDPVYLLPTPLCDFEEAGLRHFREKIFKEAKDSAQIADRAYAFIRQKIPYAFDAWEVTASETLAKKSGMCFNKTNLMAALLRSAGVPAAYAMFWIRKDGFLFTSDPKMFEKIQPETVHVYCEAYLGPKLGWRRYVETSLDEKLKKVLEKDGYRPHRNVILEKPIERYPSPEALLERRRQYKEAQGLQETINASERELSNQKLEILRNS